jgi:hypothetical protein
MPAIFEQDGVRFQYPESWTLSREDNPTGWTASLQSPGTAFFMLTYDADAPETELMVETALEAMQAEYEDLEFDPVVETIAGQPAVGNDMRFFSFDLTNTCCTRSFYGAGGTLLLFWQTSDLELETVEPTIKALCASLQLDEEE